MMKETVTHIEVRSSRDLRGPVLGLLLLRTGARVTLPRRGTYTLGSDRACDVVVADPHASAIHCILERRGVELIVYDQASKNGVWVNDAAVSVSELAVGARLRIGATTFLAYGPGIEQDSFATPSQDTLIRGQIADYGGNASRAARGLGIAPRTAQRRKQELELAPVAVTAPHGHRAAVSEDAIPIPVEHDPIVLIGRKRTGRPVLVVGTVATPKDSR